MKNLTHPTKIPDIIICVMMCVFIFCVVYFRTVYERQSRNPSPQLRTIAQKAKEKIVECMCLGDRPVARWGRCVIWDLEGDSVHAAHSCLMLSTRSFSQDVPITVFLVSTKRNQMVGTYSISKQPAYREWIDVYIVQFTNMNDAGTAIGVHEVGRLDPVYERVVVQSPGYGDPVPPLVKWIRALQIK